MKNKKQHSKLLLKRVLNISSVLPRFLQPLMYRIFVESIRTMAVAMFKCPEMVRPCDISPRSIGSPDFLVTVLKICYSNAVDAYECIMVHIMVEISQGRLFWIEESQGIY